MSNVAPESDKGSVEKLPLIEQLVDEVTEPVNDASTGTQVVEPTPAELVEPMLDKRGDAASVVGDAGTEPATDGDLVSATAGRSAANDDGSPVALADDGDGDGASTFAELADPDRLCAAVEAILFVVEAPVSAAQLATVVRRPTGDVELALEQLADSYAGSSRGIELRRIAGGVRIYTRPELTDVVEAFLLDGQRTKLSQAALETLAVIAYRQPVARGRISAIRGVNVDGVVRTLSSRGLIAEDGVDPDSGAGLFRTTSLFLEKMGLQSLDELPSLAPLLPELDMLETDEI